MKIAAKILAVLAMIILLTGEAEASEKIFVEQARLIPPRVRQPFAPPIRAPRRDYPSRVPVRPTPRYLPSKPRPSNDVRGGRRKNFGPPRAPHR